MKKKKNYKFRAALSRSRDKHLLDIIHHCFTEEEKNVICVLDRVRSFVRSENYTAVTGYVQ